LVTIGNTSGIGCVFGILAWSITPTDILELNSSLGPVFELCGPINISG